MGTCSSKDQIEKSVLSPPRSPSRLRSSNVKVPNTSSPLPDARHEFSTVADHLPTEPKDNKDEEEEDHQPFFPHEAETLEALSARNSGDGEKTNKDGKVYASAAFESSEEDATSKELQMSTHPGSLPDDYHDALDKFGKSLTDFHILKSETNPLHESKSEKNDARPLTTRSFTEGKPISENSIEESKQEPLHSAAAPSKEAKDLAEVFSTIEESHRSTANIAAPEEVGNLSNGDTAEATEAVASIQGEAKESEITPAIETSTKLSSITSSVVKEKETMEHEITNVKYAQNSKITNADEQPSVSIPDLTEKGERSETAPATSPETDIAANLPTIDSKETIGTEKYDEESHTDQFANATKKEDIVPENNNALTTDQTIKTDEKHKESIRGPNANARTKEDALLINVAREAKGLEHERNNGGNAERTESTSAEQQSALPPALEKQHEDSQTCSDINAEKEVPETVHMKENAWEADLLIPSEELHDHRHMAATELNIEADAIAITGAAKGEATELKSNDVENAQDPTSLSVKNEQLHSPPAIEEDGQETDPTLDTDRVTEIVENLATIHGTHICGVPELKEPESRSIGQQETISYPSLVHQTKESHISPVIVPVTKVDGMFLTNNKPQTADLIITTDEKHKESSNAPHADVRMEEEDLLTNAAREAKGLEHAERAESTNVEQQSTLSPALEEHEDSQTCSDVNVAKEIPETVHRKENAWETDPMTPSEELHDQLHIAATETKPEEDAIAINGVEKGEAIELESNNVENEQEPESLCVNKEQLHSPPTIEEQGQETDTTLDTDGGTEITPTIEEQGQKTDPTLNTDGVTEFVLPTINGTHIYGVQELKEPESRSIDPHETISYPSFVYQTEETHTSPVIVPVTEVDGIFPTYNEAQKTDQPITTDEKHKESSTASGANVRTEEDALLINAAREAKGLEHERKNDLNAESTNAEQQSTLSPALEEQHEDSQPLSDINAAKDISEAVHRKEIAWEADPMIPSEELNNQPNTAATETKLEEDAKAMNGVEKGDATELESSNVENAQETASPCVNKEQLHSAPAIEEQGQETEPTPDTNGVTEIVVNPATINGIHISGVQDLNQTESRSINQQETISYPSLVYQTEESHRNPVIVPVTKVDEMFPTNNEEQTTNLTITDEKHKESSRDLDANVRTEEDALLINAAKEAKGLENERNDDKNAERTESKNSERQPTLSSALEEQHEDSQTCSDINAIEIPETFYRKQNAWEANPVIASEELHDQSHTMTETKLEKDTTAINGVEKGEPTRLQSNNMENPQEPASLCVNKEQSHSALATEEQGQETDLTLDTDGVTEIVKNLATMNRTYISGAQDLKEPESRSIDQKETISYPSLVYQTEESHRDPDIVPVTKVDGMFVTDNEARTTDLTITTDERHKESSRALDANAKTEEDALLINAAREAKGLENERNDDKNAQRTESTNAEQQSTLSPALEEQHEDSETCSDINATKEIPETIDRKENAWEADPIVLSEELHDQLHTAVTETKLEEDALAINELEKGEATELESNNVENPQEPASLCVNKEQLHSPAIEEQGQETDPTLDTGEVTEIVESLATINGTPISGVRDLKGTESRSIDQQEVISYPSLLYQTEEPRRSPVIVPVTKIDGMFPTNNEAQTTDEKHKESSRAPDANVRTEEDALIINVAREAKGLEHEMNNDENAERAESTNAEQQSTLSPALEEQHEDSQTCTDINTAKEIAKIVHRNENAWETDLGIPPEELSNQSHTATTETKIEEDAIAINGVEKGDATKLESNNVENAQEPASLCVNKEQAHSHSAIEEHVQETDPILDTDGLTEIVESLATINETDKPVQTECHQVETCTTSSINAISKEDVIATNIIAEDAKFMEFECKDVKKEKEHESTDTNKNQSASSLFLKENCYEANTAQAIYTVPEFVETLHTKDDGMGKKHAMIEQEPHEECNITPDRDATTEMEISTTDEVTENAKAVELEGNGFETIKGPDSMSTDQQQTVLCQGSEQQHEESHRNPAIIATTKIVGTLPTRDDTQTVHLAVVTEQDRESTRAPANDATKEADVFLIDTVTEDKDVEHESDSGEKTETTGADEQPSTLSPTLEEQQDEPKASPYINAATEVLKTIHTLDDKSESDLSVVSEELHKHAYTAASERKIEIDVKSINGAAEENVVEVKSNKAEKSELASKYVDKPQSCSPAATEEQVEDSDLAPSTRAVKKIAENLPMVNETTTAVQTEKHHEESNITTLTDSIRDDAQTADLIVGMAEQDKESSRAPATDAITEDKDMEYESDNGKNAEKTETTGADEQASNLSQALEEQHEEPPSSQYINSAIEVPKTLYAWDNALEADPILAMKELHKHSDTTSDSKIAVDVTASNEAAERKVVAEQNNEEEKADEPESIYVDKQQSHSPIAIEEQVEDSDLAPTINAGKEIAENLHMMDETTTSVQTENHHQDSNIALPMDSTKDEDILANNSAVKVVEVTELEHKVVENENKHENAEAGEQQSVSSPVLKENCEETDITQATDTGPEVSETFSDEQQNFSSSALKECEETDTSETTDTAPQVVETFSDEQKSISSSVLKENHEETDRAHATVTAQEAVENFYTNDDAMAAKETMEVKDPYKEINMTLITNATTEEGVENDKKHENVDDDEQQIVASPVMEENSEEIDTTRATDTAPETFGDEQQKFSSSVLKKCEETDTNKVTNTAPEAVETFADEQQSNSTSLLKENCEETDIAQAADTAPEALENVSANENALAAKETVAVKEPHKEFKKTPITNATTRAGIENEETDEQQSVASPFLKENCEETDKTEATDTAQEAIETFADGQQSFSSSVLKECEETNTSEATDTAPEAVETFADGQKSVLSSVLKENCEETILSQDTDTAPKAVENFYASDNAIVTTETMAVKEPHKEFNMTLITNATRDEDVPTMDEAKENAKVQELESSSDEIIKEPQNRCFDLQESLLSSALQEHEESHTHLVNSGSTEIVGILPTKNDAQIADLMMPTKEQHEQSNKAPATDVTIEADSLLINAVTGDGYVGHESSNVENEKEMITTGPHEKLSTLSPALEEQHAESESSPAIKEATEIRETIDTWNIAQTQMIQSEQHHEESDTTSPHETTGIDVTTIKALADNEVVELESSKVEKADELASIYVENKQAHSLPTRREQDGESNSILATNTPIEILRNHPTKDVAQTTDPIASSEQHFEGSDKTAVSDAEIEDLEGVQHIEVSSKSAESVGLVTKNIDSAEFPDTDCIKQQIASFPTLKEVCKESDMVPPNHRTTQSDGTFDSRNDAEAADPIVPREQKEKEPNNIPTAEETRDNDVAMGTIVEDIKVGGLESSDVENLEEVDSTGTLQQHIVLSSALEAETEASYTFPARSAATEIVEALPPGNDAKKAELMVQTKEWQKESNSTLVTDAPRDKGATVVDAVLDDKVVEQGSNNIQNVEEGESMNVYEQQPYLFPVREDYEESQIMADINALTEIAQTHYTSDKAQITDPVALSEEEYETSHTTPATATKSAIDDIAINSVTVGEAVQRKDSDLENAEEPENEIADEQQRVSSQALKENFEYPNMGKSPIATMEIDETTGTRNNAQTEQIGVSTENFDITKNNTEAEVLTMAETNSTDVNQPSVLCQDVEEHPAVSVAVSAHCETKEIVDALLTRENTWTIDETVPKEEKLGKTDIIPATNETTEA